jgi:2-polyprenyl-3-methyl-5-hydroxy-6-metoxy-1,4-benzoquinol methylase
MPPAKPSQKLDRGQFDQAYYDRYYESKSTRVHGAARVAHLARFVTEYIAWNDGRLDAVLDIGAGAGLWRDWFAKNKRGVQYKSIEYSAYACERYGHEHRDIATWRASTRFDLIVCQGVLQYLKDDACASAIENIGAMARGFLYLEAVTRHDFDEVCDKKLTDGAVHLRTGDWYRPRLAKHFQRVGAGLWYARRGPLQFYELEAAE